MSVVFIENRISKIPDHPPTMHGNPSHISLTLTLLSISVSHQNLTNTKFCGWNELNFTQLNLLQSNPNPVLVSIHIHRQWEW
mmetsp:Transcript_65601/g.73430  ORF Transcript_65601/g.73430 Transcript_65601/m.73430 type:complete len:82 (-) Transcript_65601:192-437(-)